MPPSAKAERVVDGKGVPDGKAGGAMGRDPSRGSSGRWSLPSAGREQTMSG